MTWQRASEPGDGADAALPRVTPAIAAEAAVWVARLHGPDRSSRMERECIAWQARSAVHRLAFERCTDTWQDVARVSVADAYAAASGNAMARTGWWHSRRSRTRWAFGLAAAGMVAVLGLVLQPWRDSSNYRTGVGEQLVVMLDDGTRMSLNTNTRVRVALGAVQRDVSVLDGEALFEVVKDAARPFVVRVGASEVVALGTVFAVRLTHGAARSESALAVTLIEGRVSVRSASDGGIDGPAPTRPVLMQAGDRVRLVKAPGSPIRSETPQVDRPMVDQVVAWKRSEAVFDDMSLADAVIEMNRYSRTPIVLSADVAMRAPHISGVFRIGDNAGFARAVAALHGLLVREHRDRLELVRASQGQRTGKACRSPARR